MTSLTIQLDDRTNQRLLELSKKEHTRPELLAADAVRRRLFMDWFDETSGRVAAQARARGFNTEDDFLNALS